MKNIILFMGGIVIALMLLYIAEINNRAYNKYMCANYGYYSDCKTPLPIEKRLK